MEAVTEDKLRERFQLFFQIRPQLTANGLVELLQSSKWNERVALRKLYEVCNGNQITVSRTPSLTPPLGYDVELTSESSSSDTVEDGRGIVFEKTSKRKKAVVIDLDTDEELLMDEDEDIAVLDSGESSDEGIRTIFNRRPSKPFGSKHLSQNNTVEVPSVAPTTVTKWIAKLAGGLYVKTLIICDGDAALEEKGGLVASYKKHGKLEGLIDITVNREKLWQDGWIGRDFTDDIKFGPLAKWHEKNRMGEKRTGFGSVMIDSVSFKPGDCVAVRAGVDEKNHLTANGRMRTKIKEAAANIWFARIVSLFTDQDDDEGSAHVRWFDHGGDTILNETAGPKELFLLGRCNDIKLAAIAGKIEVERCTTTGPFESRERFKDVNRYFYRFYSDESSKTPIGFEDATFHEEIEDAAAAANIDGQRESCYCCEKDAQKQLKHDFRVLGNINSDDTTSSVSYNGLEYNLYDCIYIKPEWSDQPHMIGRIVRLRCEGQFRWPVKDQAKLKSSVQEVYVTAEIFNRYDDFKGDYFKEFMGGDKHTVRDSRRLYLTNEKKVIRIPPKNESKDNGFKYELLGKCHVVHPDRINDLKAYKELDDTFYAADKVRSDSSHDSEGMYRMEDLESLSSAYFHDSTDGNKLVDLEASRHKAFESAGRKLKAMDVFAGCGGLTAGLDASGAVETVCGIEWDVDASQTLERNFPHMTVYNQDANILLERALLEETGRAKGVLKDLQGKPLPPMPKRGGIDFVYGGCPCQDFSGCNRHRKANSIKNSLLTTLLSYVDHYRPKYFLLENVRGLLHHRLGSTQKTKSTVTGGIEQGSVKFILRALTSMGYSAQFHMLQAAEHGAPQSRRRVFFWGAKMGLRLPLYPQPTHICKGLSTPTNTFTVGKTAPHPAVVIGDAISDLPPFDWRIKARGEDREFLAHRALTIPQIRLPENKKLPVGKFSQSYASQPTTNFQREVRRHVTGNRVENHFTCRWGPEKMLRILRVPLNAGANHLDIPAKYGMGAIFPGPMASKHSFYPNRYCRLDYERQFQTCLTNVDPSGENGKILHPSQCRILSVREFARAQGFLDSFTWDAHTQGAEAMYRQIGNAVSLQLGRSLGKELFKTLYAQWESETEAAKPEEVEAAELDDDAESEFEGFDDDDEEQDTKMEYDDDELRDEGQDNYYPIVISDSED